MKKPFTALVTSGPTRERIDAVRYISNFSSGKQGHAIAAALAARGIEVTLVTGPVAIPAPQGVKVVQVETADEMLAACKKVLPVDIAVCAAAVADWKVENPSLQKMKKQKDVPTLVLELHQAPDILSTLCQHALRPKLVIGFAAETGNLLAYAEEKRKAKGCDWILANDIGRDPHIMGGDENEVIWVAEGQHETWPRMAKEAVATRLVAKIMAWICIHSGNGVKLKDLSL